MIDTNAQFDEFDSDEGESGQEFPSDLDVSDDEAGGEDGEDGSEGSEGEAEEKGGKGAKSAAGANGKTKGPAAGTKRKAPARDPKKGGKRRECKGSSGGEVQVADGQVQRSRSSTRWRRSRCRERCCATGRAGVGCKWVGWGGVLFGLRVLHGDGSIDDIFVCIYDESGCGWLCYWWSCSWLWLLLVVLVVPVVLLVLVQVIGSPGNV